MLYRYLILLLPEADEDANDKAFFSEHEDGQQCQVYRSEFLAQLSKKLVVFMVPKDFPLSQEPISGPHSEPNESYAHPRTVRTPSHRTINFNITVPVA
jgi:hypothetical protein